jgi:phage gp16-like protein
MKTGNSNRAVLLQSVNNMSNQERKDWIYEHTDNQMLLNIILDMPDDEVENELSLFLS